MHQITRRILNVVLGLHRKALLTEVDKSESRAVAAWARSENQQRVIDIEVERGTKLTNEAYDVEDNEVAYQDAIGRELKTLPTAYPA